MLELFLDSVERYWPTARWRSTVVLVLDQESAADHELCSQLEGRPVKVKCAFEEEPAWIPPLVQAYAKDGWSRGATRAMWSLHYAELYSDADFIAIMDADTVFF